LAVRAPGLTLHDMTAASIRVLVVDDHPAVRQGIEAMLGYEDGIVCVGTAASAGEAHELWSAAERPPADVVVVDRHLPDEDGLSLCLWLRTRTPAPAVVIYSAFADEALTLPAVVAGASGLVGKVADPADLCEAVRAADAGERRLPDPSPTVGAVQAARLGTEDLPILGMLRHGVPADEIAATLGLDDTALVVRRWGMLEALQGAPDHRGEPRRLPRIQATRISSPAAAMTSPGWS
jgi:DNA-binding NarL/FixJ family response regulator